MTDFGKLDSNGRLYEAIANDSERCIPTPWIGKELRPQLSSLHVYLWLNFLYMCESTRSQVLDHPLHSDAVLLGRTAVPKARGSSTASSTDSASWTVS